MINSLIMVEAPRKFGVALSTLVLLVSVTSCGESSKIYAQNSELGVFFTVPNGWHHIPEESIRTYEVEGADAAAKQKADLVLWQDAYSESSKTTAKNLLQLEAPEALTAFVRVRALTVEESDAMSYNGLRDLVLPVTELTNGTSQVVNNFQILDETEMVTQEARGLQTIFSFTPKGGENETIHQTALLSNDRSAIYFFLVRCTTKCFNEGQKNVDAIVKSLTLKGKR